LNFVGTWIDIDFVLKIVLCHLYTHNRTEQNIHKKKETKMQNGGEREHTRNKKERGRGKNN
jgi:hypothetical protein